MTILLKKVKSIRKSNTEAYFKWLISLIDGDDMVDDYISLLGRLNETEFTWQIERDSNRASDGIELRHRYEYETGEQIVDILHKKGCSILEMIIALADRCENTIMDDYFDHNSTSRWFWKMIRSLGLMSMDNAAYDEDEVDYILDRFLTRTYERNGKGGLFYIKGTRRDLRKVEIWYQLNMYLSTVV